MRTSVLSCLENPRRDFVLGSRRIDRFIEWNCCAESCKESGMRELRMLAWRSRLPRGVVWRSILLLAEAVEDVRDLLPDPCAFGMGPAGFEPRSAW